MAVSFLNGSEKFAKMDITSEPKWFIFDVDFGVVLDGDEDFILMYTPEGLVISDIFLDVYTAEAGATSSAVDLELTNQGGASTTVLDFGADCLGSSEVYTVSNLTTSIGGNFPRSDANAPEALQLEYDVAGTPSTGAQARIGILMHRLARPGDDDHLDSSS